MMLGINQVSGAITQLSRKLSKHVSLRTVGKVVVFGGILAIGAYYAYPYAPVIANRLRSLASSSRLLTKLSSVSLKVINSCCGAPLGLQIRSSIPAYVPSPDLTLVAFKNLTHTSLQYGEKAYLLLQSGWAQFPPLLSLIALEGTWKKPVLTTLLSTAFLACMVFGKKSPHQHHPVVKPTIPEAPSTSPHLVSPLSPAPVSSPAVKPIIPEAPSPSPHLVSPLSPATVLAEKEPIKEIKSHPLLKLLMLESSPAEIAEFLKTEPFSLSRSDLTELLSHYSYSVADKLGKIFEEGLHGMPKNPEYAFVCFKNAADRGNIDSAPAVGRLYAQGIGTPKDVDEAIRYYRIGSLPGGAYRPFALYRLGYWLRVGTEKNPKNLVEARKCLEQSLASGFASAATELEILDKEDNQNPNQIKEFTKLADKYLPDFTDFFKKYPSFSLSPSTLKQLLSDRPVSSIYRLGTLLENGTQGMPKSPECAFVCFKFAADEYLHSGSTATLGRFYEKGIGTAKDLDEAINYYKKGSVAGAPYRPYALYRLGALLTTGTIKNPKDLKTAKKLYLDSFKEGYSDAFPAILPSLSKDELIQAMIDQGIDNSHAQKSAPLFLKFASFQDAEVRGSLTTSLLTFIKSIESLKEQSFFYNFLTIASDLPKESCLIASSVFFGLYPKMTKEVTSQESEALGQFFEALKASSNKKLKEDTVLTPLLRGIKDMAKSQHLTTTEKLRLWQAALKGNIETLKHLHAFVKAGNGKLLQEELGKIKENPSYQLNLKPHIGAELLKVLGLDQSYLKKYESTFGKDRDPSALLTYAANLSQSTTYPCVASTLTALKEFVTLVLENKFTESRYDLTTSKHLEMIFKDRPHLLKQWRAGKSKTSLNEGAKELASPEAVVTWLKEGLRHCKIHVDEMPRLKSVLAGTTTGQEALAAIAKEAKLKAKTKKKKEFSPVTFTFKMQRAVIELIVAKTAKERVQKMGALMALSNAAEEMGGFHEHLKELADSFQEKGKESDLTISMTDDRQDLFLSGTEILGSCQAVDNDAIFNKCLLGHVMNGKTQMICIRDPQDRLVARRLVRLFWDPVSQSPVMMLERFYTNRPTDKELDAAILKLAKAKAKEMGLRCVVSGHHDGALSTTFYPNALQSYEERAPYEYLDGILGDDRFASRSKTHSIQTLKEIT